MNQRVACKGCDLVINVENIEERELPIKAQTVFRLRCQYCSHVGEYTAQDIISNPFPRVETIKGAEEGQRVVCVLSWIPELAKTRKWLLVANGYTVLSLIGTDGIRQLVTIEKPDLLVLAHSVPPDEKHLAIELFKRISGAPVLSLLAPHGAKLPEADYGVEAFNPDEFVAAVKDILSARAH